MCRCINGRCQQSSSCQCRAQSKKCTDCWCVLCSNLDQQSNYQPIMVNQEIEVPPVPTTRRIVPTSSSSNTNPVMNQPKKYYYYCGCGVSKCAKGNCGCKKRGEKCNQGCGCPEDCMNGKPKRGASQNNEQKTGLGISGLIGNFNLHPPQNSTPPPNLFPISNPSNQPNQQQHNPIPSNAFSFFPPRTSNTTPPSIISNPLIVPSSNPQPISAFPLSIRQSQFQNIESITTQIEKININSDNEQSKLSRCCKCIQCDKNCKCFKNGDCCVDCRKDCLNLDLKEADVNIPNYIKF